MVDQAASLRQQMSRTTAASGAARQTHARVIAIASGKGGVGKSNFCVNFALALIQQGLRVLVIDADVGFANIEVLLNITPAHSLLDLVQGHSLAEVIETADVGLALISGGSGLFDSSLLDGADYERLSSELRKLSELYDVILLDCGAGVNEVSRQLFAQCDELLLVTTPEPTAMTDAYALLKLMIHRGALPPVRVVVNRAPTIAEAKRCADVLGGVTKRFLAVNIGTLGYILEDAAVLQAVMRQIPVLHHAPHSRVASCYQQAALNFIRADMQTPQTRISRFFERLFGGKSRGGRNNGYSA